MVVMALDLTLYVQEIPIVGMDKTYNINKKKIQGIHKIGRASMTFIHKDLNKYGNSCHELKKEISKLVISA